MVGIGTWSCRIDTLFFKGDASIKIFDNNGEYGVELQIPDVDIPDVEIVEIDANEETKEVDAVAHISLLPGKDITCHFEFEDEAFSGFLKIPFLGKVRLKDGKKLA
ncbi:MAG: hypothetical protein LBT21_05770 [Oscillospiraceae bacterium]|jgi:hypothetical protein|nr:hypothetical protein [Oscillospiraceae bacterium]